MECSKISYTAFDKPSNLYLFPRIMDNILLKMIGNSSCWMAVRPSAMKPCFSVAGIPWLSRKGVYYGSDGDANYPFEESIGGFE